MGVKIYLIDAKWRCKTTDGLLRGVSLKDKRSTPHAQSLAPCGIVLLNQRLDFNSGLSHAHRKKLLAVCH